MYLTVLRLSASNKFPLVTTGWGCDTEDTGIVAVWVFFFPAQSSASIWKLINSNIHYNTYSHSFKWNILISFIYQREAVSHHCSLCILSSCSSFMRSWPCRWSSAPGSAERMHTNMPGSSLSCWSVCFFLIYRGCFFDWRLYKRKSKDWFEC